MGSQMVRIFLASPGDVAEERACAARVVEQLDREIGRPLNVALEILRWETHAAPGLGRPQALISPLVDECEIFIGILWTRFGSPPGTTDSGESFSSGTEEEFLRAHQRWAQAGGRPESLPRVMFYFSDRVLPPSQQSDQFTKVVEFRKRFSSTGKNPGLYHVFESIEQFERDLRSHLIQIIFNIVAKLNPGSVIADFVSIPPGGWNSLFSRAKNADILLMYGKTWRNTYLNMLRDFVTAGGKLRVLLPTPDVSLPALILMAVRLGRTPDELAAAIRDAAQEFLGLSASNVEVRFTKAYLTHAMYLFDRGGYVALYSYSGGRAPSPALQVQDSLLEQFQSEFRDLFLAGTDARGLPAS